RRNEELERRQKQLEADLAAARAEIERLENEICELTPLSDEEDAAAPPAGVGFEEPEEGGGGGEEGEGEEGGDDDEDEDADADADLSPSSPATLAREAREETEFYRQQCLEAEEASEAAADRAQALEAALADQLLRNTDLAQKVAALGAAAAPSEQVQALAKERDNLREQLQQQPGRSNKAAAGAAGDGEAAELRRRLAALQQERDELSLECRQLKAEKAGGGRSLAGLENEIAKRDFSLAELRKQLADLQQRVRDRDELSLECRQLKAEKSGGDRSLSNLKNEIAKRDFALADLRKSLEDFKLRYDKLQQQVSPKELDVNSPEVKAQAQGVTARAAKQMTGKYDKDYPTLFDLIYEYERRITHLNNDVLSLNTVIKIREQDLRKELTAGFECEKNDLLAKVAILEIQISEKR
ncbi:hypothetical protein DIPPA_34203, partial [Diplonema papillatum]